ncbi:hypothetical protein [Roseivirga echinicomitans]|nr:hypothetical protein [Roseivirga echinicomitans]
MQPVLPLLIDNGRCCSIFCEMSFYEKNMIMNRKIVSSLLVMVCFFISFTAFGWRQESSDDKITAYKGKDAPMIDENLNFCKGTGFKCAELTTSQMTEIIKALKQE